MRDKGRALTRTRCCDCIFYSEWESRDDVGTCRRRAPTIQVPSGHPKFGEFPVIAYDEFCGEGVEAGTRIPFIDFMHLDAGLTAFEDRSSLRERKK